MSQAIYAISYKNYSIKYVTSEYCRQIKAVPDQGNQGREMKHTRETHSYVGSVNVRHKVS